MNSNDKYHEMKENSRYKNSDSLRRLNEITRKADKIYLESLFENPIPWRPNQILPKFIRLRRNQVSEYIIDMERKEVKVPQSLLDICKEMKKMEEMLVQ